MALKLNLAPLLAAVVADPAKAETVAAKAMAYAQIAEQAAAGGGVADDAKLAMVKSALIADLRQVDAPLAASVADGWPHVAGAISGALAVLGQIAADKLAAAPCFLTDDSAGAQPG